MAASALGFRHVQAAGEMMVSLHREVLLKCAHDWREGAELGPWGCGEEGGYKNREGS